MGGKARTGGPEGGIEGIRAQEPDLDPVLSILEEAAWWLVYRGIDQWQPGSFSRRRIADRIGRGEMYLAKLAGQTFGTLAIQWSDEEVWGDDPGDAGYVHGLAIRRRFAGKGLGRELLGWAEERAGFRRRGRAWVWGLEVSLYEKRVDELGAG